MKLGRRLPAIGDPGAEVWREPGAEALRRRLRPLPLGGVPAASAAKAVRSAAVAPETTTIHLINWSLLPVQLRLSAVRLWHLRTQRST